VYWKNFGFRIWEGRARWKEQAAKDQNPERFSGSNKLGRVASGNQDVSH